MVTQWGSKGCQICRRQWEAGMHPPELAVSDERRATLHRCEVCGTLWEQFERYADIASLEDVHHYYRGVLEKEGTVNISSPSNELEKALVAAKAGTIPMREFILTLIKSNLAVPSTTEMQSDGSGLTPLFFDKEGVGMLATFTDKSRISELTNAARYCLDIRAFELFSRIPKEYGVVINPGSEACLDIPPNGITEIVIDYSDYAREALNIDPALK